MPKINEKFASNLESFETVELLKARIAEFASHGTPVSYSQLVSGITFMINGEKYIIDTDNWTGLGRRIVGDYLFQIIKDEYRQTGILSTMIVFSQETREPSQIVQDWLKEIGAYRGDWLRFWSDETRKVVEYYKRKSIDAKH